MSIFIKPGFWEEKATAPKHWFNLNKLITSIVNTIVPAPTYKSLVILVTQSADNDPTLISTLENTIGEFALYRDNEGVFRISFTGTPLIEAKTTCEMANNFIDSDFVAAPTPFTSILHWDNNSVVFYTAALNNPTGSDVRATLVDGYLSNPIKIEIRVYN